MPQAVHTSRLSYRSTTTGHPTPSKATRARYTAHKCASLDPVHNTHTSQLQETHGVTQETPADTPTARALSSLHVTTTFRHPAAPHTTSASVTHQRSITRRTAVISVKDSIDALISDSDRCSHSGKNTCTSKLFGCKLAIAVTPFPHISSLALDDPYTHQPLDEHCFHHGNRSPIQRYARVRTSKIPIGIGSHDKNTMQKTVHPLLFENNAVPVHNIPTFPSSLSSLLSIHKLIDQNVVAQLLQCHPPLPFLPGPIIATMTSLTESRQARSGIPGVMIQMCRRQIHRVHHPCSLRNRQGPMCNPAMLTTPSRPFLTSPRQLLPIGGIQPPILDNPPPSHIRLVASHQTTSVQ